LAADISTYICEMLSTNRVLDSEQSLPEYGITAEIEGATISLVFTFLSGKAYCCEIWGCHLSLHPGTRWDELRRILTTHGIALPEQLDLSIRVVVEEGALFFEFVNPNPPRQGLEYPLAPVAASSYDDFSVEADLEPPMLLQRSDGLQFSMKAHLMGFQFKESQLPICDRGRPDAYVERGRPLVTAISLRAAQGEWQSSWPTISTTELDGLATWLESVARGQPSVLDFDFEQRGLEFSASEALDVLNVHLSGVASPDWADDEYLTISFPLAELGLNQAVAALRSQLSRLLSRPMPKGLA
jgi:hypothetical protein